MATKLKNSIKKYFTEVWFIEIIIVLLIGGYFFNELYNSQKSTSYLVNLIKEVKNPEKVYKEKLKEEGKLSKKEEVKVRREKIKDLLAEGLSQKEIYSLLKISKRTCVNDVKFLKEQGLI